MKRKIKVELVYSKNKETNMHEEECYDGYVSINGQKFRFWNAPWTQVMGNMRDKIDFVTKRATESEDVVIKETKEKKQPKANKLWKLKYHILGMIPRICPYCTEGEVIARGFVGHNRRYECRSCGVLLVNERMD